MKKILIVLVVLILVAAGAAFYFWKEGFSVRIPEKLIQESVAKQFPMTKTHLMVLKVTYSDPLVEFLESENRVRIGLTATADVPMEGEQSGTAVVNGGIRYDPGSGSFFLTGFAVESLSLKGGKGINLEKISSTLSEALEGVFAKFPVYTLSSTDKKQQAAKMLLKDIRVTDDAIVISFGGKE